MRRDYFVTLGAQLAQAAISLGSVVVLARVLMPVDFGIAVLLTAAITIGSIAIVAGVQAAVLVTCARRPELRSQVSGAILLMSMGLLVIAVPIALATSEPLARALSPRATGTIVLVTAFRLVPTIYAGLVTAALTGAGRIGTVAILGVISALSSALMPLGSVIAEDRLLGATGGALAGNLLAGIAAIVVGLRRLGLARPSGSGLWRELWSIAAPLHIGTVAYWFMLRADAFILNAIVGGAQVGIYGLAVTLTERVSLVTTPLYNATAWRISGTDPVLALRTCVLIARTMITVGLGICVLAIVAAPTIVEILAGPDYRSAGGVIPILVLGAALLPAWGAMGLFLVSQDKRTWYTTAIQLAIATFSIPAYIVAIRLAGMYGAAAVSTAAYATLTLVGLIAIRARHALPLMELLPTRDDLRSLFRRWPSSTDGEQDPVRPR